MFYVLLIVAGILTALGRRIAGGVLQTWTGVDFKMIIPRSLQALTCVAAATFVSVQMLPSMSPMVRGDLVQYSWIMFCEFFWPSHISLVHIFVGVWIGASMGFPTGMGVRDLREGLGMAAHGLGALLPLIVWSVSTGENMTWLFLAGLLRSPIYAIPREWSPVSSVLGTNKLSTGLVEWIVGFLMGPAIMLTWR